MWRRRRCGGISSGCWGRGICRGSGRWGQAADVAEAAGDAEAVEVFEQGDEHAAVHVESLAQFAGGGGGMAAEVGDDAAVGEGEGGAGEDDIGGEFDGLAGIEEEAEGLAGGWVGGEGGAARGIEGVAGELVAEAQDRFEQVRGDGGGVGGSAEDVGIAVEAGRQQGGEGFIEAEGVGEGLEPGREEVGDGESGLFRVIAVVLVDRAGGEVEAFAPGGGVGGEVGEEDDLGFAGESLEGLVEGGGWEVGVGEE
jgi:hypothetical protein